MLLAYNYLIISAIIEVIIEHDISQKQNPQQEVKESKQRVDYQEAIYQAVLIRQAKEMKEIKQDDDKQKAELIKKVNVLEAKLATAFEASKSAATAAAPMLIISKTVDDIYKPIVEKIQKNLSPTLAELEVTIERAQFACSLLSELDKIAFALMVQINCTQLLKTILLFNTTQSNESDRIDPQSFTDKQILRLQLAADLDILMLPYATRVRETEIIGKCTGILFQNGLECKKLQKRLLYAYFSANNFSYMNVEHAAILKTALGYSTEDFPLLTNRIVDYLITLSNDSNTDDETKLIISRILNKHVYLNDKFKKRLSALIRPQPPTEISRSSASAPTFRRVESIDHTNHNTLLSDLNSADSEIQTAATPPPGLAERQVLPLSAIPIATTHVYTEAEITQLDEKSFIAAIPNLDRETILKLINNNEPRNRAAIIVAHLIENPAQIQEESKSLSVSEKLDKFYYLIAEKCANDLTLFHDVMETLVDKDAKILWSNIINYIVNENQLSALIELLKNCDLLKLITSADLANFLERFQLQDRLTILKALPNNWWDSMSRLRPYSNCHNLNEKFLASKLNVQDVLRFASHMLTRLNSIDFTSLTICLNLLITLQPRLSQSDPQRLLVDDGITIFESLNAHHNADRNNFYTNRELFFFLAEKTVNITINSNNIAALHGYDSLITQLPGNANKIKINATRFLGTAITVAGAALCSTSGMLLLGSAGILLGLITLIVAQIMNQKIGVAKVASTFFQHATAPAPQQQIRSQRAAHHY